MIMNIDEAIARIESIWNNYNTDAAFWYGDESGYEAGLDAEALRMSAEALKSEENHERFGKEPEANPEPQWIPVMERLPKMHGENPGGIVAPGERYFQSKTVLACTATGERWLAVCEMYDGHVTWECSAFCGCYPENVIAWMPVPAPYQLPAEPSEPEPANIPQPERWLEVK